MELVSYESQNKQRLYMELARLWISEQTAIIHGVSEVMDIRTNSDCTWS